MYIFLLWFLFVVFPQLVFPPETNYDDEILGNITDDRIELTAVCSANYTVTETSLGVLSYVLDLLQGTVSSTLTTGTSDN